MLLVLAAAFLDLIQGQSAFGNTPEEVFAIQTGLANDCLGTNSACLATGGMADCASCINFCSASDDVGDLESIGAVVLDQEDLIARCRATIGPALTTVSRAPDGTCNADFSTCFANSDIGGCMRCRLSCAIAAVEDLFVVAADLLDGAFGSAIRDALDGAESSSFIVACAIQQTRLTNMDQG